MKVVALLGRIFFSLIFIASGLFGHIMKNADTAAYAQTQGVPSPSLMVYLSGLISVVGGLCILLGFKAKFGAWLIVLFLLPVTFAMHKFWMVSDPMMQQMQMSMFMKNISMLGGALLIAYFGAGPYSLDNAARK